MAATAIFIWGGTVVQEVWGRKSLVGSRGEAPVGDEAVYTQCLQILTAEMVKV